MADVQTWIASRESLAQLNRRLKAPPPSSTGETAPEAIARHHWQCRRPAADCQLTITASTCFIPKLSPLMSESRDPSPMLSRGSWERGIVAPSLQLYIICVIPQICLASLCLKPGNLNQEAWTSWDSSRLWSPACGHGVWNYCHACVNFVMTNIFAKIAKDIFDECKIPFTDDVDKIQ